MSRYKLLSEIYNEHNEMFWRLSQIDIDYFYDILYWGRSDQDKK